MIRNGNTKPTIGVESAARPALNHKKMKSAIAGILTIICCTLIVALVACDFFRTAGHFDVGDTSYAIHSPERITIDGQWGQVICIGGAITAIVCQMIQLRELRKK